MNGAAPGVVALAPEGQFAVQLLGRDQVLLMVIKVQLQLEGGEEALNHRIVPAATLGRHAAENLSLLQQSAVVGGPVLAPLIGVDRQLLPGSIEVIMMASSPRLASPAA